MEDGENGAKRLWNSYTREKSSIFLKKNRYKNEKVLELGRKKNRALTIMFRIIF